MLLPLASAQVPTADCAATTACVTYAWVQIDPEGTCSTECGRAASSLTGTVVCKGSDGSLGSGSDCAGTKPAAPTKACAATAACVTYEWAQIDPAGTCSTECGRAASIVAGSVACKGSDGSLGGENDCAGAKPAAPTKPCAATAACVAYDWQTTQPDGSCPSACGHASSSLLGSVKCRGSDGSSEPHSDGRCTAAKPDVPTKPCAATAACVTYDWVESEPTGRCPTACGHSASVLSGAVVCKGSDGAIEPRSEWKCEPDAMPQEPLTRVCAATPVCVTFAWDVSQPSGSCPTACGHAASTNSGAVVCRGSDGPLAPDDECRGVKPEVPNEECPTTVACDAAPGAVWDAAKIATETVTGDDTKCHIGIFGGDRCASAGGVYLVSKAWFSGHYGGQAAIENACGRVIEGWLLKGGHSQFADALEQKTDLADHAARVADVECGATTLPPSVTEPPALANTYSLVDNKYCKDEAGKAHPGGRQMQYKSRKKCRDACTANPTCTAWTWAVTQNTWCVLIRNGATCVRASHHNFELHVRDPLPVRYTWDVSQPTGACPSACGHAASQLASAVVCKGSDGSLGSDSDCTAAKPNPATKTCAATAACVTYDWETTQPDGSCPTACGHAASTLAGLVKCVGSDRSMEPHSDGKCTGAEPQVTAVLGVCHGPVS